MLNQLKLCDLPTVDNFSEILFLEIRVVKYCHVYWKFGRVSISQCVI